MKYNIIVEKKVRCFKTTQEYIFRRSSYLLFLLIATLLWSCQNKTFEWDPGISAPANYPAGGPSIVYYYKGNPIAHASSGTAILSSWGGSGGGFMSGENKKVVPDSVSVTWDCAIDEVIYKGGSKLPYNAMLQLFRKGYTSSDARHIHQTYDYITAALAPGGHVSIFLGASDPEDSLDVEVFKKKKKKIGIVDTANSITLRTAKGREAKEILQYVAVHGTPYSIWEKGEKSYHYTFGVSSQDNDMELTLMTLYTKDGSFYQDVGDFHNGDPDAPWLLPNTHNIVTYKRKLPIHIVPTWGDIKTEENYYMTDVVLPQNFEQQFAKGYTNPKTGKHEAYNCFVIGIEKGGEYAQIWLSGKNAIKPIMRFKAKVKAKDSVKGTFISGGYAEEVQYF